MKWTYFLIDFFSVIVPFLFSFHPRIGFYRNFLPFIKANLITSAVFILWDMYFTHLGVWSFSKEYTLGIYLYNLPIEEVLFFIFIPFACMFTNHCLQPFLKVQWSSKTERVVVIFLILFLTILGMVYRHKAYTMSTTISTALLLFVVTFLFRVKWLVPFLISYLVLLLPFFVVNGLLTGTGLEHPVVSYNNEENLGIRILTIPVEDMVYGFELLLLNRFLFK